MFELTPTKRGAVDPQVDEGPLPGRLPVDLARFIQPVTTLGMSVAIQTTNPN